MDVRVGGLDELFQSGLAPGVGSCLEKKLRDRTESIRFLLVREFCLLQCSAETVDLLVIEHCFVGRQSPKSAHILHDERVFEEQGFLLQRPLACHALKSPVLRFRLVSLLGLRPLHILLCELGVLGGGCGDLGEIPYRRQIRAAAYHHSYQRYNNRRPALHVKGLGFHPWLPSRGGLHLLYADFPVYDGRQEKLGLNENKKAGSL